MTTTVEAKRGVVKWFDFTKRYGFVTLDDDGGDAMLHLSCIRRMQLTEVPKGSIVEVEVEANEKGLAVKNLLTLQPPPIIVNGANYVLATVRWFDKTRGYGFVSLGAGTPDIFIHAETVKASSILDLKPDQPVLVVIEDGEKGRKVIHVKGSHSPPADVGIVNGVGHVTPP